MMKKVLLLLLTGMLALPGIGSAVPGFMLARMGTMEGQVFVDGKPAVSVLLAFFMADKGLPPISSGGMGRIPDAIDRADEEGKFSVQLMEGSYYLGILFRPADDRPGPPRKGEKFYFANDGHGKLRRLAIADFKKSAIGRIDCSLPGVFKEEEDHFAVEGVVLTGAGDEKPMADALVLAKRQPTAMRPEYISPETGPDGKFSIKLPPGETFFLVARGSITGSKPNPGEEIGKLGVDKDAARIPEVSFTGAPLPPSEDFLNKAGTRGQLNDTAIPVSGKKGEVISGLKIHMFKMPDSQAIREERQGAAGTVSQGAGNDSGLPALFFAANSDKLSLTAMADLDSWVKYLQENKDVKVEVGGYADASETGARQKGARQADFQKKLAERRATAVTAYLRKKGVDAGRMVASGHGAKDAKGEASPDAVPEKARRVEIKVLRD